MTSAGNENVADRVCGVPRTGKFEGEFCLNHTTAWFASVEAFRCRFHKPEGEEWPYSATARMRGEDHDRTEAEHAPELSPCPVDELRSLKDVEKMCEWAVMEVVRGSMSDAKGKTIVSLVKEWRSAHADRVMKIKQEGLRTQLQKIKKAMDKMGGNAPRAQSPAQSVYDDE